MKKISIKCYLLILMLIPFITLGQSSYSKFSKSRTDKDDIFTLIEKAETVSNKDPKLALSFLEQALSMSIREGNKKGEALSYSTLGKINYAQGLFSKAVEFYQKSLHAFEILKDKNNALEARKNMGQAYEGSGDYERALKTYTTCLADAELMQKSGQIIDLKFRIGRVNEKLGKLDKALVEYKEVLTEQKKLKNKEGIISANNKIGDVYLKQEKTKKAKKHYEESQELAIQDENKSAISQSVENLSKTYRQEKNYDDELALRKQSAKTNSSLKDTEALSNDYQEIGQIYLDQKAAGKALPYLEKSAELSAQMGKLEKKVELYSALSEAYKQEGDFVKALEVYKTYVATKDSLFRQKEKNLAFLVNFNEELNQRQKKIDLLEKDRKLKEQTIQLLREDYKFNRLIIYGLIAGLFLVFGSSWLIYNSSRKRRIAHQVLALKSLRSQMNPHFIFNALNSVNNYISKNDERSANKYLSDFSKLMRTVMENSQHEFISLSTELSILELYLTLEHERFKEKFEYELKVAKELQTDQIEIPPMFIQPYIENAIWHGLRYRESKGLLKVSISNEGAILKIVVEDNGIGIQKSQELKTVNQKDKESTGLKNTHSRMKIINELYGTRMKVNIEDLTNQDESGTRVSIYLTPAKKKAI